MELSNSVFLSKQFRNSYSYPQNTGVGTTRFFFWIHQRIEAAEETTTPKSEEKA